jgi:hypothetical protein
MPRVGGSNRRSVVTSGRSLVSITEGVGAIEWPVATSAILPGRSAALRSMRAVKPARAACCRSRAAEPSLSSAHVPSASSLIRNGTFVSWRLDDYFALFHGQPAPDEPTRSRHIDAVDVRGTVATASMILRHGPDTFTDVFLLVLVDGRRRIANKAYHRH